MFLNLVLFIIIIVYLLLILKKLGLINLLFNNKLKLNKYQEGKITIHKISPKKKTLNIEAETIDFEEIKDKKKS